MDEARDPGAKRLTTPCPACGARALDHTMKDRLVRTRPTGRGPVGGVENVIVCAECGGKFRFKAGGGIVPRP